MILSWIQASSGNLANFVHVLDKNCAASNFLRNDETTQYSLLRLSSLVKNLLIMQRNLESLIASYYDRINQVSVQRQAVSYLLPKSTVEFRVNLLVFNVWSLLMAVEAAIANGERECREQEISHIKFHRKERQRQTIYFGWV